MKTNACKRATSSEHPYRDPAPTTTPFLRWPGGKRWLIPVLVPELRQLKFQRYFEPFLGGGAMFFALQPLASFLSDINADLINTYRQIKYRPRLLLERIKAQKINSRTFQTIRESKPRTRLDRAARFLYLNRTAFSGMYRVNRKGEFNVPFGGGERTTACLWEDDLIVNASRKLRQTNLKCCDFEDAMAGAGLGDLVYCDPTYTVAHNNNGFIRYNDKNFSWHDQQRLAECCRKAASNGAAVFVSNAFHAPLLDLYQPTRAMVVSRRSLLCPQTKFRKHVNEYLFLFAS